jgi:DNA repair protein RecN (Recombination protein N)
MLRELEVKDLGIIDTVRLELPVGFCALTGETGAGKSLLVQSLQLLAGARADAEQVRGGCDRLLVEGCFGTPTDPGALALLSELGIDGNDELVLRREVSAHGRSRAWINDVPVTIGALARLAPHLLAIDGQHEQRGLADPTTHIGLVDAAGGLETACAEVGTAFTAWQEVRDRLEGQRRALASRRDRLDVISYQLREIEEARLAAGEDEELREERTLLRHSERIGELLVTAQGALGGEGGTVALARAARAVRELQGLGLDLASIGSDLEQAQVLAEEAERGLLALAGRVRPDPPRLENVEARLALLERMAKKYGGSVASVLEHHERLLGERAELDGVEDDIVRLEDEERRLAAAYLEHATALSKRRVEAGKRFATEVVSVLAHLGMPKVKLALVLARRINPDGVLELESERIEGGPDGIDVGELHISSNPGEPPRPMAQIASGGELSRLHLAIRTVLRAVRTRRDPLTLLFDEVDSGIGGRVADELGELLARQGERDQVLVVTHLPQVAARAESQLVVHKEIKSGRTVTRVAAVTDEARVDELVRMLGGADESDTARAHARALLRRT